MYLHYYVAIAVFEIWDEKCSFFEVFGVFLCNHECLLQLMNAQELIGNQLFNAKHTKSESTTELKDRNLQFKTLLSALLPCIIRQYQWITYCESSTLCWLVSIYQIKNQHKSRPLLLWTLTQQPCRLKTIHQCFALAWLRLMVMVPNFSTILKKFTPLLVP